MKIIKKNLNTLTLAICVVIAYCIITPAMVIVTLLNKSFMLGFVVGVQTMLMRVLNKNTRGDLKNFRKHDEKHYIAQPLFFSYDMQKHYYIGDKFKDLNLDSIGRDINSGLIAELVNKAGVQGFFFDLIKEVYEVLGKDAALYNGYDISEKHFTVHFNIKKEVYTSAIKNFRNWSYAKDFDKLIDFKEQKS